jgi:TRAP-type C4-dicarboxylate transport system permease small subunit
LLIWSTFFGAGCVYKHSGHISITVLQNLVPEKVSSILQLLVHALCMVLFALIVWYGIIYFGKQGNQLSPALRLPMRYVYTCIPIGCSIMFIHALDAFLGILTGTSGKEEA